MFSIKNNILAALAYFDMFNYPLTSTEIYLFLKSRCDIDNSHDALNDLVINRVVYQFDNFYSLKNEQWLIDRRRQGNKKAAEMIAIAGRISNLLIRFPYVRGIAISGSLSKNFADENSDIDLFVITEKNRLWIARTLMHAFKKLTYLVGKQEYFCMNYYIDEQQLEIVEQTVYTAIEVVTLIPLQGDALFERFYHANRWTRSYLPNKVLRLSSAKAVKNSVFKNLFEWMFNTRLGDAIDNLFMQVTKKRWLKKTEQMQLNAKGKVMALAVDKHFAKPDPKNFQGDLLVRYETKVARLITKPADVLAHSS